MTIRQRITLLVLLMVVAIGGVGAYAISQSRDGARQVKSVTEGVVPSAIASGDLVSALKDVQIAAMTMVSAPDDAVLQQAIAQLALSKSVLSAALEAQGKDATTQAQRGLLEQAKEGVAAYYDAIDASVAFKSAGKHELAHANIFGNVLQYQAELEQIVQTVRVEKNRVKDKAVEALNADLAATTRTVSIATLIAVAVLGLIGALLYRRITRPIARMQQMMSDIAHSQDFSRSVPIERMDEIGHSIAAFNEMIGQIRASSEQLRAKTADIQAMLQNMHQGILTIADGMQVHPEYSAYMETILERDDIAGHDFIALMFEHALVGPDVVAQVDAACRACIGEDLINFEFNEHLLIGELRMRMQDGRIKTLELAWSPIVDEQMTISRLMLCMRDVTELRELAVEAGEQRRKLEIVGEILAVEQDKFLHFVSDALQFAGENQQLLRQAGHLGADAVAQLFRNMHTIKGNARTYALHHITNAAHQAEQTYDRLRAGGEQPGREVLLAELERVAGAIREYAQINEHTLGRKAGSQAGRADRYLMVDKAHIRDTLHRLESVNTANVNELVGVHYALRQTLRQLGSESIADTLSEIAGSLPSLAAQLGKPVPALAVNDRGLRVQPHLGGVLKNVFMHLVRNAIDHGIETAAERAAGGKQDAGIISVDAALEGKRLVLRLRDDGRGIALQRIRQVAGERGLAEPAADLSDEETANLIFHPGFTTARALTEVSGRGVGMDAVREFVWREQGEIAIAFLDGAAGAPYRAFQFVITLPADAAMPDAGEKHAMNGDENGAPAPAHDPAGAVRAPLAAMDTLREDA